MSRDPVTRSVDAGQVLTALREAGIVGPELRSLVLDRAWPWRRGGLCALYVDRRGLPGRREWTVLHSPEAAMPRPLRLAVKQGRVHRLPSLGALVVPPLSDPELPVLELLDGELARERLRPWSAVTGPVSRLRVRPRGYKPLRRLTVEYRVEGGDGAGATVFGKALRPRDLDRVLATAAALETSPAAAVLSLPRAVDRRWNVLLVDARPGTALDRLVPGPAAVRGVAAAGETLATVHAGSPKLPRTHSRRREVETLDRWLRCAARACPEMAARLDAARRRLARVEGSPAAAELVPGHRDFHPGQLLLSPERVTVLDLDTAAMTEPELDAGNFLAHLDLFELDRRSVPSAELGDVFRSAYERRAGRRLDPSRLLWYRAAAVLRLACVYRFRPRGAVLGTLLTRRCMDLLDSRSTSLEVV